MGESPTTIEQLRAALAAGRRDLRRGMRKALFLRAGFWDWMYRRALHPTQAA